MSAFGEVERRLAALLAGQVAVTAALRHDDEVSRNEHLRTALSARSVIGQALGIIMGRGPRRGDRPARTSAMIRWYVLWHPQRRPQLGRHLVGRVPAVPTAGVSLVTGRLRWPCTP